MDFIYVLLTILFGFLFIHIYREDLTSKNIFRFRVLWIFHLMFGVIFYFFTRNGGGDAWAYWRRSKEISTSEFWELLFEGQGTSFLDAINFLPSKVLGMGFFANTILYSFLGFVGIFYFCFIAIKLVPYNSKYKKINLFPAVFFLPSLHFWSSGVGKDSLLLFCIGLFTYSFFGLPKKIVGVVFSILLIYLIRPHIAFFLIISFGIVYLLESKIKTYKRIFFALIMLLIGFYIFPIVMEFAKIEEASVEGLDKFTDKHVELLKKGSGSAVDISSYPFPVKIFTFLFRPLFFDVQNILGLLTSFENLFLIILVFKAACKKPLDSFKRAPFIIKGLLIFLIIGAVAFSFTLSNLGIMLRMRNMFLPGLLIYLLWSLSNIKRVQRKKKLVLKGKTTCVAKNHC